MSSSARSSEPVRRPPRYSILALARHALRRHRDWAPAWRSPEPARQYDAVIIGGGGHGLATAYYLASRHGMRRVAVLEKGWIGGGNTGRNTTIVRANYAQEGNAEFYAHSLGLWQTLSQELNFNVMFSPRGMVNLFHTPAERDGWFTRYNAVRLHGMAAQVLDAAALRSLVPALDFASGGRHPVLGAVLQPTGGTARHDAVAWGYARAADAQGVDIIQNCEVLGIELQEGRVHAVQTTRGRIETSRVGSCVAGSSSLVAALVGLRLPIETHLLQATVTEPIKPLIDQVVSSAAHHVYVSQTDKGEILIGGRLDGYNSYSQRGSLPVVEEILAGAVALFPQIAGLRVMRGWAGAVDMSMDGAPIISATPVPGFYLDGGWCYGGFKATPAAGQCMAHTMFHDSPHPLNVPFALSRFASGQVVNERGAGAVPGAH